MTQQKYEYKTLLLPTNESDNVHIYKKVDYAEHIEYILNEMGKDGWKLVRVEQRLAIFAREIIEGKETE